MLEMDKELLLKPPSNLDHDEDDENSSGMNDSILPPNDANKDLSSTIKDFSRLNKLITEHIVNFSLQSNLNDLDISYFVKIHSNISSIRSSLNYKFISYLQRKFQDMFFKYECEVEKVLQYETKLALSMERCRNLTRNNNEMENRIEELNHSLSYHKMAADRLQSLEKLLAEAEEDKMVARNQIQLLLSRKINNSTSRDRFENDLSIEYKNYQQDTSNKNSDFNKHKFVSLAATINDISEIDLMEESEKNLNSLLHRLDNFSVSIRSAKDKKLKERAEYLEKMKVESNQNTLCCVCHEAVRSILILPCRHLCICEKCVLIPELNDKCPICRAIISDTIRVFC